MTDVLPSWQSYLKAYQTVQRPGSRTQSPDSVAPTAQAQRPLAVPMMVLDALSAPLLLASPDLEQGPGLAQPACRWAVFPC